MKEILPGVFHWTVVHPRIRVPVSSYWFRDERVVLDPLVPEEGAEVFDPAPQTVILTNRHHYRDSGRFQERFGCKVWCVRQGLHEFRKGETVEPFDFGDLLPGGFEALEIDVLCPDETALFLPAHEGILAVADGVIRDGDGPLAFVPDAYLGDDPATVKAGLRRAYGRVCAERSFEHLLPAHGNPWVGGARAALEAFSRDESAGGA